MPVEPVGCQPRGLFLASLVLNLKRHKPCDCFEPKSFWRSVSPPGLNKVTWFGSKGCKHRIITVATVLHDRYIKQAYINKMKTNI